MCHLMTEPDDTTIEDRVAAIRAPLLRPGGMPEEPRIAARALVELAGEDHMQLAMYVELFATSSGDGDVSAAAIERVATAAQLALSLSSVRRESAVSAEAEKKSFVKRATS